jgi:hypothetical protein
MGKKLWHCRFCNPFRKDKDGNLTQKKEGEKMKKFISPAALRKHIWLKHYEDKMVID